MADPTTVAFACGVFFGLFAARVVFPPVNLYVRQSVRTWNDKSAPGDDEDEGESWKNGR